MKRALRQGGGSCGPGCVTRSSTRRSSKGRLDAVEAFVRDVTLRREVRKSLYRMHDLERLATRLVSGGASARDLAALARSLSLVPGLRGALENRSERALGGLGERMGDLSEVQARVAAALLDDPPLKVTDGGLIRDGFDGELDALRAEGEAGRAWLAALEAEERERTGIPTLKNRL